VNPAPGLALTTKYYVLFVQDAWKLTPRLTVNWGVRWEYETPRTDRFNQLTNFDYSAASPLQAPGIAVHGGLVFVGVNGQSRYNAEPDRYNFAPRLGIAYRLTQKTAIRAGAGLFYASNGGLGGGAGPYGTSGFQAGTSIVTSLDGITPIVRWNDPYPSWFNRPTGSRLGLATLLGQSIQFYDRSNVTPYSEQWNFNIQQGISGNVLFEIGYAGSRGLHFPENRQWNQLAPGLLLLGDALRQQVTNPYLWSDHRWGSGPAHGRARATAAAVPAVRGRGFAERRLGFFDLPRAGSQTGKAVCQRSDDSGFLHLVEADGLRHRTVCGRIARRQHLSDVL
jgi:hypothetical protein